MNVGVTWTWGWGLAVVGQLAVIELTALLMQGGTNSNVKYIVCIKTTRTVDKTNIPIVSLKCNWDLRQIHISTG